MFALSTAAILWAAVQPLAIEAGGVNITKGCVRRFDPKVDYFPDKISIRASPNFRVEYHNSYKIVTVAAAYAGGPRERYLLVQCGAPRPAHEVIDAEIVVPITSLFVGSTTQVAPLADLERMEVLAGVPRLKDLAGDRVFARSAANVREFAAASVIDSELVVAARPSLIMTAGGASASFSVIRAAGVPVVADTDWLEQTALARAEWMKFVALFLNEERRATVLYGAMQERYQSLSAAARSMSPQPVVMTGRSTNGRFVIAGGRSYVASLIADAGGRYVWADNASGGAPAVDLEAQVHRAANADIWINGGGWPNREAMLLDEPRYAAFKSFRAGQVWVYERQLQPSGANEYWTRGASHPDTVLADLVKIFHPSLLRDRTFEWYMAVPSK